MSRSANVFGKLIFLLIASICAMQLSMFSLAPLDPLSNLTSERSISAIHAIKAACDNGILRAERTRERIFAFLGLFFAAKAFLSGQRTVLSDFWQSILPILLTWRASTGAIFESAPQSDMVLLN